MALSCGLLSVGLVLDPGPNARSGVRLERERVSKEIGTAVRAELSKTKNKATKQTQPANKPTTAKSARHKRSK